MSHTNEYTQLVRDAETLSLVGGIVIGLLGPNAIFSTFASPLVTTGTSAIIFTIIWVVSPVLAWFLSAFGWHNGPQLEWVALISGFPFLLILIVVIAFISGAFGYSTADQVVLVVFTPFYFQVIANLTARLSRPFLVNFLGKHPENAEYRRILALWIQIPTIVMASIMIFIM